MCYISQNLSSFNFGKETANISRRYHDFFCTIILSSICKRFAVGASAYTAEELSKEHKIPIRLTKKLLYELQDMKLILETSHDDKSDEIGYTPAIDINVLTVGMLLSRLDSTGSEAFKIDRKHYSSSWDALIKAREEYLYRNNKILLKDL